MTSYGFVIDNRKCIGCHACTVACKAEHEVPVGVNRTWVKYVEKGEFPNTERAFHVMRCNHCEDAPCVEACPVTALYVRDDGIVDFDWDRCIGCNACIQACPYDALYTDPGTHTTAKCNYCAHRVDVGLEPACVNVCPEEAIISGDIDDPETPISRLLAREKVTVRKPEKGTKPKLFYIDGDEAALTPGDAPPSSDYMWGNQRRGVGRFVPGNGHGDGAGVMQGVIPLGRKGGGGSPAATETKRLSGGARRTYDAPNKGVAWGKEVPGYVWTKAIASGSVAIPFLIAGLGVAVEGAALWAGTVLGLVFMVATGACWSWTSGVRTASTTCCSGPVEELAGAGAYIITGFGGLLALWAALDLLGIGAATAVLAWPLVAFAVATAVYTAFLFGQAKGRDFWQSPALPLHMLAHAVVGGAAALYLASLFVGGLEPLREVLRWTLGAGVLVALVVMWVELGMRHPTLDAERAAKMIYAGRYKVLFWVGSVLLGSLVPLAGVAVGAPLAVATAAVLSLVGMLATEHAWVEAPQTIPLA
ncbi:4Fe-4S dicluster domain-containing protein [Rubrobacter marinus]|uniref:4Fe-4S dicluster domain-containing protein n=1 Tax=Rubrobacter marinus TaxID=2653852 RepID=UPI001A9EAF5D|nr:4Fe-4S dicluster domain-containing protein [Rubrobacter marinus]